MMRVPTLVLALIAIAASGCSNTQDVLNPSAVAAAPPTTGATAIVDPAGPPPTTASAPGARLDAALAARTRLRLDPIVGASVESAGPLTERIAARARSRGIVVAGSADPSTTHVIKGYFSVMTEGAETTVIYVWDIYDASGNRLHRITGQQKAPSAGGQGWPSVTPATMQLIADTTIDQFAGWLATTSG